MVISVQKLVPLIIAGTIGLHAQKTLKGKIQKLFAKQKEGVATYNMRTIVRTIKLNHVGERNIPLGHNAADFIRQNVMQKAGDPAKDPWGNFYRLYQKDSKIIIMSAGPDKQWNTTDDLQEFEDLFY